MPEIPLRMDSTFRFILVAARRAEQLMRGSRPKVDTAGTKPSRVALAEISQELVEWSYGPPPVSAEAEIPPAAATND